MSAAQSMMIVHNTWNDLPSFKLIPFQNDSPYIEVIFDAEHKSLGIVSKEYKPKLQYVARLDENGEAIARRGKLKPGDEAYQMHRITIEAYYEYYLTNLDDILELVHNLAVNPTHPAFVKIFPSNNVPYSGDQIVEPAYKSEIQVNPRMSLTTDNASPEINAALDPELTPDNQRSITEALVTEQVTQQA